MEFPLTKTQQKFFDLIDGTHDNYFLNGPPGTGKSVLLRAIDETGSKVWTIAAPTGLAALNANGKTLHSIFRLPVSDGILAPDYNRFPSDPRAINNIKYNVTHLMIDEISMVRADTLDYIDRLMQFAKNRPGVPFGGVQVIVVGDFFQLPPIVRAEEKKQLKEAGYASPFAFSARVWETFKPLSLTEVLRQKDDRAFIDLLHAARTNDKDRPTITPKQMVALNARVEPDPDDVRISLTGTNAQSDEINQRELNKLDGPTIEFHATSFGDWPQFPADTILKLRIGAQVMVKMNKADRPPDHEGAFDSPIVNGTLGVVVDILQPPTDGESTSGEQRVVVDTRDHGTVTIYSKRWERKVKEKIGDEWTERVVASFEQMPLSLAWAISMHKSQGQSFDVVHIDAAKIFAGGQFYVALSRCRTLKGVTLQDRVSMSRIYASKDVLKYFAEIEQN